eukprot:8960534-Pyramimonas_sp.AAC.1
MAIRHGDGAAHAAACTSGHRKRWIAASSSCGRRWEGRQAKVEERPEGKREEVKTAAAAR